MCSCSGTVYRRMRRRISGRSKLQERPAVIISMVNVCDDEVGQLRLRFGRDVHVSAGLKGCTVTID